MKAIIALLFPVLFFGKGGWDYCSLMQEIFDNPVFYHCPAFSRSDSLFLYEEGGSFLSGCDIWVRRERFFCLRSPQEKVSDSVYFQTPSASSHSVKALSVVVRHGREILRAEGERHSHKLKYFFSSYRNYVDVWISWKSETSSVSDCLCFHFRRKKGKVTLIAVGQS